MPNEDSIGSWLAACLLGLFLAAGGIVWSFAFWAWLISIFS